MMIRAAFPAAALLLVLTACVSPPPETSIEQPAETPAETPAVAKPVPAAVEVVIEPPAAPQPVVTETETEIVIETSVAALTTPEPEPEPEPPVIEAAPDSDIETDIETEIDDDPEQLMGLAGLAVVELLGDPGFLREDADAQVWQYRGHDCMLDIYLYRDGEGAPHKVTYYEFRGDGDERPCLRELLLN